MASQRGTQRAPALENYMSPCGGHSKRRVKGAWRLAVERRLERVLWAEASAASREG